jgi:glyoxylase-like metal-dependent hydrolase (beta-lactamase superfamily II)
MRRLPQWMFVLSLMVCGAAVRAEEQAPVWDGNRVELMAERLAPGVYAFYPKDAAALNAKGGAAATSAGLIAGDRAALVVDTMLNKRLSAQLQALVKRSTSVPLAYAVNTSAHGDHSYGNMYLPRDVRIIQSSHAKRYVDEHLADDKAFMIKYFGAGRGIEEITARTGDLLLPAGGRMSVDLGGRTVDIIDFGFAQTGGDLFVWEPQSKVLWTGNALIARRPALPWLLDGHLLETLATLQKVYDFLPDDARIVPGHGVPVDKAELRWNIDYLTAVRDGVQGALKQGLSLEQTVQKVTLPDYAGYVLFGWVHSGLNVPAAYKDLSPQR